MKMRKLAVVCIAVAALLSYDLVAADCISSERVSSGLWVNYKNNCAGWAKVWQTCNGKEATSPTLIEPCGTAQTMCDKNYELSWRASVENQNTVCGSRADERRLGTGGKLCRDCISQCDDNYDRCVKAGNSVGMCTYKRTTECLNTICREYCK